MMRGVRKPRLYGDSASMVKLSLCPRIKGLFTILQKAVLSIVVFIIILIALTFGESIGHDLFAWVSHLTGLVIHNFSDLYNAAATYVLAHTGKVLTALILTVPITWWILKNKGDKLNKPGSRRKMALVLAIFLGWLGGNRFYLGEFGMGILYLVILYVFAPLAVVLGLIDAVRYIFMSRSDAHTSALQSLMRISYSVFCLKNTT